MSDGVLELVAIKGASEMGSIIGGLTKPKKIAQGHAVKITLKKHNIPMQGNWD